MTIGRKVLLSSSLLVAFTAVTGSIALVGMGSTGTVIQSIVTDALPGVYQIGRVESAARDMQFLMLMHVASGKPDELAQLESQILSGQESFRSVLRDYEKTITRARDRELYEKIGPAFDGWLRSWDKAKALSKDGKPQEALAAFRIEAAAAFRDLCRALADETEFNRTSGDDFSQQATSALS